MKDTNIELNKTAIVINNADGWGVLFDLDGVLVDSESEYTKIWNRIDEEYPTGVKDFARKIKGTTLDSILSTYFPDPEIRRNVEKRLYELEAEMVYDYCPGAKELLDALRTNHIPIALFTSSNDLKMAHLYKDIPGIRNYFDVVITGDMVSHSKPDPEGYLLAAKGLGIDPTKCIVVEDSLQGVKAGEAAGCKVVGVAGTLNAEVLSPHSNIVVNSIANIGISDLEGLVK